jgi:serine/threonine protein kinase
MGDALRAVMLAVGRTILAKRFEILELAGHGGMGQVYRARDQRDGSTVAVKVLASEHADSPRMQAQLDLEAAALDGCRVRGVPRLIAQGRTGGMPFVVMSWRDGQRLCDLLHANLPLGRIFEIVLALLQVVGDIHARGWIHGDINTSNVLVRNARRGRPEVSLIDLGLARRSRPGEDVEVGHEVCGTPSFMAPELLRGVPTSVASDLYAVGALFFALLTGRAPVGGSPMSVAMKLIASEADSICDCGPGPLGCVLRRALQRDPARRFASAREMQAAMVATALGTDEAPARHPVDPGSATVRMDVARAA